jgi:hypothetical protein
MLRIAALAPWPPHKPAVGDGVEGAESTAGAEAEQTEAPEERESAREHFRAGAHALAESISERLRHSPETMNSIMLSIRESSETLGLTKTGKHSDRSHLTRAAAVGLGIIALLALVMWALFGLET